MPHALRVTQLTVSKHWR